MSDRSRRLSTIKSAENQEERNRLRSDIKASKKVSAKLGQLIELEEAELTEFEETFQDIAETVLSEESTSPAKKEVDTSILGATGGIPGGVQEVLELEIEISSNDSDISKIHWVQ